MRATSLLAALFFTSATMAALGAGAVQMGSPGGASVGGMAAASPGGVSGGVNADSSLSSPGNSMPNMPGGAGATAGQSAGIDTNADQAGAGMHEGGMAGPRGMNSPSANTSVGASAMADTSNSMGSTGAAATAAGGAGGPH